MKPVPYTQLSDFQLLCLCVWREARGEEYDGQRGVAWVIRNRTLHPGWWGKDWKSVILHPWQFSSFNASDPNNVKWPLDAGDLSYDSCVSAAAGAYTGVGDDPTAGACWYHDASMGWPAGWGDEGLYQETLKVGRLTFYRSIPKGSNQVQVQQAVTGEL
jgi:spore germination cell wall hydrolase CwlJ-like protein